MWATEALETKTKDKWGVPGGSLHSSEQKQFRVWEAA